MVGPFSGRQILLLVLAVAASAIVLAAVTTPLGTTGNGPGVVDPRATPFVFASPPAEGLRPGSLAPELEVVLDDGGTFQLTDLDGVTQSEAARRMNLTVSGMKSRVQRARVRLRSAFEECCRLQFDARGAVREFDQPAGNSCQPSCRPRIGA